jgi:hypothetical protein
VTRLRFVVASRGDPLLSESIALIADVASDLGVASDIVLDAYPEPDAESIYVVVPHELFELVPDRGAPAPAQLQRTIALCSAPPGETEFHISAHYAQQTGAAMHLQRGGCEELQRLGIAAEHFQFGYSPRWDRWRGQQDTRGVDVLHIGARDDWRERTIAGWAPALWRHRCRFVLPQTLRERSRQLDGLLPDGRLQALREARVLLYLHHRTRRYLEWPSALAAIANGCVLVSECLLDAGPLRAGEHYLSGPAEQMPQLAAELLADESRLRELREGAHRFVCEQLPLANAVRRLLDIAARLERRPAGDPWPLAPSPPVAVSGDAASEGALAAQLGGIAGSLKRLSHETLDLRRRLERIEHRMTSRESLEEPIGVYESESFLGARPRISVIVSLYEYEYEVRESLASVAASELSDFELLILDDASRDASLAVAREALAAHPHVPSQLLRHLVNRGVARTRNALIERARGEFVFVLDADNLIFPSALQRLLAALERDPEASFAYPIQVAHRELRAVDVFNAWPWDPRQLVQANYIDAMALIRRDVLTAHGGYVEDPRIGNSEDHDLWCRMAEREQYGVLVPEMLAVYRVQEHSKLRAVGGAETGQTLSLIRARVPNLIRRLGEGPAPRGIRA